MSQRASSCQPHQHMRQEMVYIKAEFWPYQQLPCLLCNIYSSYHLEVCVCVHVWSFVGPCRLESVQEQMPAISRCVCVYVCGALLVPAAANPCKNRCLPSPGVCVCTCVELCWSLLRKNRCLPSPGVCVYVCGALLVPAAANPCKNRCLPSPALWALDVVHSFHTFYEGGLAIRDPPCSNLCDRAILEMSELSDLHCL
ncbi:hypothetical protein RRG08_000435 [Elysia crispata]|uniref:Uncharacterized protein n=1 Tax=Elysia crispata TaxID=231223 RepID=A0AAE0YBZ2_9GAST|nr:hypothetical protein RRG08_000435 [Elysia crispata]